MIRTILTAALLGTALLAACDDAPTTVDASMAVVAGSYTAEGSFGAITFTSEVQGASTTVDWLAAGGSVLLELKQDGTTTGRLFLPFEVEEGEGPLDEDLIGAWSVANGVITFDHEADTFIRDTRFTYADGVLTGVETFGGTTVRVVLQRR